MMKAASGKEVLNGMIKEAHREALSRGLIVSELPQNLFIDIPKRENQGDYSSNIAMLLSKKEGKPGREIAENILSCLKDNAGLLDKVEVAGPGFINFTVKPAWWHGIIKEILAAGEAFGRSEIGKGRSTQIEFVSANPTGPLHIGHGRWAAVGQALSNLLKTAGYRVDREYYNNDVGRQVKLLGRSVYARYQQSLGNTVSDPEDGYRGEYIKDLGEELAGEFGERYKGKPEAECLEVFTRESLKRLTEKIRRDLGAFGVGFDNWFSEESLHRDGAVEAALDELSKRKFLRDKDGALWFLSTQFGDDKDRVVRKEDGEYTYLASDIAYHKNKLDRGYDRLINIWGADHHGYTARMKAVVEALGYQPERLTILIGQLVTLLRKGKPIPMSKRSGEFITLRDVLDEVGKDAAVFFFLMRRLDTHLDFDLELAKQQSNENPVYYVQYAHARLSGVLRQAEEKGIPPADPESVDLGVLREPEELKLMKQLSFYPSLVEDAAEALEPHRLTFYLQDLAAILHNYYFHHRFISDERELTQVRLVLVRAVRTVMANALGILGVAAPDRM
ncbi:MAG TPA: arginine--tRNA ligase [Nitrospiria bacterium]